MDQRVARARIHADFVRDSQPLDGPQRVRDLLRQPFVAGHDGDAQQLDHAGRVQLRRHHGDLPIVAGRREVGIEDHFFLGGGYSPRPHQRFSARPTISLRIMPKSPADRGGGTGS